MRASLVVIREEIVFIIYLNGAYTLQVCVGVLVHHTVYSRIHSNSYLLVLVMLIAFTLHTFTSFANSSIILGIGITYRSNGYKKGDKVAPTLFK